MLEDEEELEKFTKATEEITIKTSKSIKQETIDNLLSSMNELIRLNIEKTALCKRWIIK